METNGDSGLKWCERYTPKEGFIGIAMSKPKTTQLQLTTSTAFGEIGVDLFATSSV